MISPDLSASTTTSPHVVTNDASKLRKLVLMGNFMTSEEDYLQWKSPSNTIKALLSSTFVDTMPERNISLFDILPEVQEIARARGIEILLSDMRYGVKDKSTVRQMTWIECAREIEECFKESGGLSFMSLVGDRYGIVHYLVIFQRLFTKIITVVLIRQLLKSRISGIN